jgi:hypothetical protein
MTSDHDTTPEPDPLAHPDCQRCRLLAAFRATYRGGPEAEIAFRELRRELLGT